jgi:hypothetical protein
MTDAKAIIRQLAAKKQARALHEPIWQECLDYSFPERGTGLNGSLLTVQDGQTKKNRILDDTAADSARVLSSGIVSGTTPASSLWFGLDAGQESDEENAWLDEAARILFENIHGANFDSAAFECCIDIVATGWFVLYIDEAEGGGFNFEQWPLAQCYISASRLGGPIDTLFREVEMTVEQLVGEYGMDKVSAKGADCYRQEKYDEKVSVIQAIYPRRLHAVGGRMAKNLPYASVHVEVATQHMLKESGYHEFPCAVPRWMLVAGTPYPTGPMAQALGSIRTINDIKAMELANLDMAVAGMWIAEDDGVLNPRSVKVGPRRIIVANSVDSMKPLTPGSRFDVAFTAEDRLQAAIRKILLADQLTPQDGPAMTATEVHARVNLIRQLLGPIYGRLQAEYLQPMITRCFGLAYRAGVLGQAPESLQDRAFSVKYLGPLARAQRLEDVTAMDRYETTLMQEAQADPTVLDVYDFEAAARERSKFLGVPQSLIRTQDDVDKLRDARKEAQQGQQQQQMQQQVAADAVGAMVSRAA